MAIPSKPSPYRRRPSLIRNLWIYRRLVALAVVLGILLWFMVINNTPVKVVLPFHLASIESTTGMVILLSGLLGSALTAAVMTLIRLLQGKKVRPGKSDDGEMDDLPGDRPPSDYASKTTEGFPNFH